MTINRLETDKRREYEVICREAIEWVREAGAIARGWLGRAAVSRKADRSPVTEADMAAQAHLLGAIGRAFPDDAAISEETQADPDHHASAATARRCWVIDPVDGTRNFARGFPVFTVSVAMLEAGEPVIGMVHDPMSDQMYWAVKGGGLWLDDERVERPAMVPDHTPFISIPTSRHEELGSVVHGWIDRMVVRNLGTTALHLAFVAIGGMDAAFSSRCRLWDIAAGAVLLSEAGLVLRDLDGGEYFPMDLGSYRNDMTPFLAGEPELVAELVADYRREVRSARP